MIITFVGNSKNYFDKLAVKQELNVILAPILIVNPQTEFFCGCKGCFDEICAETISELKTYYPDIKRYYITPYLTEKYQQDYLPYYKENYDAIIFPNVLETCPIRLAYIVRNQWMIRNAAIIISGVLVGGGGSEATLRYAHSMVKTIIPIANTKLDWL